jgi:hypothetical protein
MSTTYKSENNDCECNPGFKLPLSLSVATFKCISCDPATTTISQEAGSCTCKSGFTTLTVDPSSGL